MKNLYYFNSWEDIFLSNVRIADDKIILVSPYIKFNIIKKILSILPKDKKIELIIISRFTKKSFKQKKSDLNLFDFLVNNDSESLKCKCYNYKNLDSNIYIFDAQYMYIGSSTLSKQGLIKNHAISMKTEDREDIKFVSNEIYSLIDESTIITNDDISKMRNLLNSEQYDSFTKGISLSFEEDLDPLYKIEKTVTSLEEESELSTKDQLSYNTIINTIINYRNNKSSNNLFDIENEKFNTSNIVINEITSMLEQEALSDYNKLCLHITKTFSEILAVKDDSDLFNNITNCFIHSSWQSKFTKFNKSFSVSRKSLLKRLGEASFYTLLATSITKSRLFKQGSNELFHNTFMYMKNTYPYIEILESLQCDIFLYLGDIKKNYVEDIFFEILGVLTWYLDYESFKKVFINYFDYSDEYVYDEYKIYDNKTLLQELTQQKYGLPTYIKINESGPDHRKEFVYQVNLNNKLLGEGIGYSKRNAQENAAKDAVNNFIKEYSYIEKNIVTNYKLIKYKLLPQREKELLKLNSLLPRPISNLSMLDVAFTHISVIRRSPFSRSNDALSFLGSFIEELTRKISIIDNLDEESLKKYIEIEQNIKVTVALENYFDKMKFNTFLNSNIDHNKITTAIKTSCIQALLSIYFLEYGLNSTVSYIKTIWNDFKLDESSIGYTTLLLIHIQSPEFNLSSSDIEYKVLSEEGKDHNKFFIMGCYVEKILYGKGKAKSKKEAKRLASKETLNNLSFKSKYKKNNVF